ncbi:MAG: class I tRNA ligase family protein [Candidatus Moeniiplasma glomeromycotorum]|nr:class I tRNA ligase family protein [Candidatus Moeniiplasma glomeromycotorum]MCE8166044.1 class I tRNA ligase family protein [Candidatus Moeniiplasma glomeromycotorum]
MTNQTNEKILINQWILKELALLQKDYFSHLEKKEINLIALKVVKFTREKFSNEYLELVKIFPWEDQTKKTLLFVYQQLLLLLHPLTPFLTEYIYQEVAGEKILKGALSNSPPHSQIEVVEVKEQEGEVLQIDFLLLLLSGIRQVQLESNANQYYLKLQSEWKKKLNPNFNFNQFLEPLTKSKVFFLEKNAIFNASIDLPPFGVLKYQKTINLEGKKKDLEKQLKIYHQEYQKSKKLLENPHFLQKASPLVVAKARENLTYYQSKEQEITKELEKL